MANGQTITRSVGFAILRVEGTFTIDEVVFAEQGDLLLLAARTLEGLNLTVDPAGNKLVAAGPLPAATAMKFHEIKRQDENFATAFALAVENL